MVDSQGQSKGSGFVAFSSAEDAIHAVSGLLLLITDFIFYSLAILNLVS